MANNKKTRAELAEMNRIRRNRYYEKHKEEESAKNLKRYHDGKKLSDGDIAFPSGSFVKNILPVNSDNGSGSFLDGYGAYDR